MGQANKIIDLFPRYEPEPFDPSKPVETKSGWKARILCIDADHKHFPIVALVFNPHSKSEQITRHDIQGRHAMSNYNDFRLDLVNI